jgi:hypothetical protein
VLIRTEDITEQAYASTLHRDIIRTRRDTAKWKRRYRFICWLAGFLTLAILALLLRFQPL